jgi:5-methylcytosine-specific restriction endonuclease McrA
MTSPRLAVDLSPRAFWRSTLANNLPRDQWEECRQWAFERADFECEVCGAEGDLQCDEIWSYNKLGRVRMLDGLRALCPACHQAKHFGLAVLRGREQPALAQLMRVNGWTRQQAKRHTDQALAEFMERNTIDWATTDLSWLRRTLGINADL